MTLIELSFLREAFGTRISRPLPLRAARPKRSSQKNARGVWRRDLVELAGATALCYPAVLDHQSCVARVNPATALAARLGKPMAVWDTDGTYAGLYGDPVPSAPPPAPAELLQELDAIV